MDPQLQSAFVAAAVTVGGFLVRDVGLKTIERRRERTQTAEGVYRSYADPLTRSAENLYWRLNELFNPDRSTDFLMGASTEYERYKLLSTSYRIAAFLGWRQAFSRELLLLPVQKKGQLRRLNDALEGISKALADGHGIERYRLKVLTELWSLEIKTEDTDRLAASLDTVFNRCLDGWGVDLPLDLEPDRQRELCLELATQVQRCVPGLQLDTEAVDRAASDVACRISVREFWIYRDWQAGIGDFMLGPAPEGSPRMYEVIGFAEFEARTVSPDDHEARWLGRLEALLSKLDLRADPNKDARVRQLKRVHEALALLLVVVAERSGAQRDYLALTGTLASADATVASVATDGSRH